MKQIIQVMMVILFALQAAAQQLPFDGEYKGTNNGVTYTLTLKNNSGAVSGTVKNDAYTGDPLPVLGTVAGENSLKGVQKEFGVKIKFVAMEQAGVITWESKGWFIEAILTKQERTMKFFKVDKGSSAQSNVQISERNEADSQLIGTWVYTETNSSADGTISYSRGLRLTEDGLCQRSNMVSVNGDRSGSLDDWQGNMKWYTKNKQLFIVEDGDAQLAGTYTVGNSGMILLNNGIKEYYAKR